MCSIQNCYGRTKLHRTSYIYTLNLPANLVLHPHWVIQQGLTPYNDLLLPYFTVSSFTHRQHW